MNINKQRLQHRLDNAEAKYNRLMRKTYPSDRVSEFFHLGTVGGSGKPVQKLNRQRERDLARRIDDAKEMIRLRGVIADLKRRIRNADQPANPSKPRKASTPRPVKPAPSTAYLDWASALLDDMESRIEAARSKMNGIQWDDLHDHHLRGEIAAYIQVQAHLIGEHFRGNSVSVTQVLEDLDNLVAKKEIDRTQTPSSHYLPEYCKGLIFGVQAIKSAISQ